MNRSILKNTNKGFSLVEVLVVIAIIGVLATFSAIALNSSRIKARDAQRVAYINQMNTALELFYLKNNYYPTYITAGQVLSSNGNKYLDPIPSNPSPRTDGNCPNQDFTYTAGSNNVSYSLSFCLSQATGNFSKGLSVCSGPASCESWLPTEISGLVLWLKGDSFNLLNDDLVTSWTDSSGNSNHAIGIGTARPTYKTNVLNGKPTVRFDGNDVVNFTSVISTIRTAIFVVRYTTGYQNHAPILGHASLYEWHGSPIGGNIVYSAYASASVQGATAYSNGTLYAGNTVPRNVDNFHLVEFLTTGNATAGRLGNDRGGSWFMGDYAEVILYNNVISAAERKNIEIYLSTKYGLSIAGL